MIPTFEELKKDLLHALDIHIDILKGTTLIATDDLDGVLFMMRSFGFMLDHAPAALLDEDLEEMYFLMFQYYRLLSELKHNLRLYYPDTTLQDRLLETVIAPFPTTYDQEMTAWWEQLTGLSIDDTKQTIKMP